jgi:hypothetical protein
MTDTIRERIIQALVDKLTTQSNAAPVGDPYPWAWDSVLRAPITNWAYKRKRTIGVFDMHETKKTLAATKECVLRIALEIALVCDGNENPSEAMNEVFGVAQRRFSEDTSLGGLCKDLQEVSNDLQVEDENKRWVRGVIMLDVSYRHGINDPRKIV